MTITYTIDVPWLIEPCCEPCWSLHQAKSISVKFQDDTKDEEEFEKVGIELLYCISGPFKQGNSSALCTKT